MNKYDIINYLGKKYNLKNYLEISTITTGTKYDMVDNNFFNKEIMLYETETSRIGRNDINIIPKNYNDCLQNLKKNKYDIIFVDPFHTFEQSKLDLNTALSLINNNGFIIVHDCFPKDKNLISDKYKDGGWCGVTYKSLINFWIENPYLQIYTIDTDYGCAIISMSEKRKIPYKLPNDMTLNDVSDFKYFCNHGIELVNLISIDYFYLIL